MKKCEICGGEAIKKERYCKHCKKVVKDEAQAAGKIRDIQCKTVTEAGTRKCRSTRLLSGAADNIRERFDYEE